MDLGDGISGVSSALRRIARVTVVWVLAGGFNAGLLAPTTTLLGAQEADTASLATLRGDRVTVRYAEGDSTRAARYMEVLSAQPPLPALPDSLPTGVTAYLAPSEELFLELVGSRVPEWSAGVAIPHRNALIIPAFRSSLTRPGETGRVLRHEWAHLGLHQYLEGFRIPRWFDEGYAEWAGGWDATEAWRLRIALATGGTPSLDSLSFRWPDRSVEAREAYLLSATAVEYLVRESGARGLEIFLARWREIGSFERALRRTYGVTSGQLEEDWREYVKDRYGWVYVLSHSMVFWALLAMLMVGMAGIRRRHRRERMARLRAGEPPERPAFWLDEEEE